MKRAVLSCLILISVGACQEKKVAVVADSNNPVLYRNTAFELVEDLHSPKFEALKVKYQIDTVFHGERDEFKRQLLLRNWIRSVIQISDFEPSYPGEDYAERILDEALSGQGYHCGHYMIVQNAVMNAYGYVTRCLGAGPGVKGGPDGHHGINEVWSNKFGKWYLSDAKYDHHFEKQSVPLSALEIRQEYLKNGGVDLILVKGPDRTIVESDLVMNDEGGMDEVSKERFAQTYTWIEWEKHNDRYTNWPDAQATSSVLNMYEDDYFKGNTWIWDGKPHWAYTKPEHMIRVTDRRAIEWTPNIISSRWKLKDDMLYITLSSETPNFKTYQMMDKSGEWNDIDTIVTLQVNEVYEELVFRTMNLANVAGPEHRLVLTIKK